MTLRQLERALRDESISDKKFFKTLLRYFKEQDAKRRKSKMDVSSIHFWFFKKRRTASVGLRLLIRIYRPVVSEMVLEHVLGLHERCCGPKRKSKK